MTRDEARKAAEIMLAYADGKEIEMVNPFGEWVTIKTPKFNWDNNYRVKPEPTYRPFKDKEECWAEMQKHQPFGWITLKTGNHPESKAFVIKLTENCFYFIGDDNCVTHNLYDYEFDKHFWSFADGTPFGIKEE